MSQKKVKVLIDAAVLRELAWSAANDVSNGDDSDPYVKKVRAYAKRAHRIAEKAIAKAEEQT